MGIADCGQEGRRMTPVDTMNRWLIGSRGESLVVMAPPRELTHEEALVFAAYLVAMVGDEERWQEVLAAVQDA